MPRTREVTIPIQAMVDRTSTVDGVFPSRMIDDAGQSRGHHSRHNEEKALPHVLAALATVHSGPVLVVDGGSTDATVAAARHFGATVLIERRRGYGRACMTGAERAIAGGAEILVFLDGDHSDDPNDLPRILAPLLDDRADIVLGARVARLRAPGAMAAHQSAGNGLVALLIRCVYGVPITDPGPFRAMRAAVFRELDLRAMTYTWQVEAI